MARKKNLQPSSAEATADERLSLGRSREEARFTAPPPVAGLPAAYASTLEEIKRHLQQSRLRTVLAANASMVMAYWDIGQVILARQQSEGWGTKVIDHLSADLREAFPGMEGLSPRNLLSMKLFAQAFSAGEIAKQPVSQLPWGHIVRLLQMVKDPAARAVYIQETIAHGWSRSIMQMQIERQLHLRLGSAQNNFPKTLPPPDSDLAVQAFKDPYLFDFLGTADLHNEAEAELALVDHIQ